MGLLELQKANAGTKIPEANQAQKTVKIIMYGDQKYYFYYYYLKKNYKN